MTDYLSYRLPSKCERVYRTVVSIGMGAAFVLLAIVGWWLLYPYQGVSKWEFVFDTPVVQQGALFRWHVNYCVDGSTPLPVTIQRELELQNHTVIFPMPEVSHAIVKPCETKHRAMGVPEYAPPGVYRIVITTRLQVNPFRVVQQSWVSPPFTVVAK
jgi:hypothetical protein